MVDPGGGAHAVLEKKRRYRLRVERRRNLGRLTRQISERDTIDERIASACFIGRISPGRHGTGILGEFRAGPKRMCDLDPLIESQETLRQQPIILEGRAD